MVWPKLRRFRSPLSLSIPSHYFRFELDGGGRQVQAKIYSLPFPTRKKRASSNRQPYLINFCHTFRKNRLGSRGLEAFSDRPRTAFWEGKMRLPCSCQKGRSIPVYRPLPHPLGPRGLVGYLQMGHAPQVAWQPAKPAKIPHNSTP